MHKLLQINCGIAFVLVSAKKIFNVMRRIKTFFRIPMEIKLLDSSNLQLVADDFAKASETLINYFVTLIVQRLILDVTAFNHILI